jgi:hypothetical protein
MSREGFEPTIPVFERTKTVLALDHAATVIGQLILRYVLSIFRAASLSKLKTNQSNLTTCIMLNAHT